ncbi:hypothetical protein Tco_0279223, partial [Tanacetum coccineum]
RRHAPSPSPPPATATRCHHDHVTTTPAATTPPLPPSSPCRHHHMVRLVLKTAPEGGCVGLNVNTIRVRLQVVEMVMAHGGAWFDGSGRLGDEKHFWTWPENSPEKFFGGGGRRLAGSGGGGRRLAGSGGGCRK